MIGFGTFGFGRRKKPILLEEPKALILEDFSVSSEEFYDAIEAELAAKQMPDLTITRELFAEGGLLSLKRVYLRMRRERYIFDICASPFGTSYFFSALRRDSGRAHRPAALARALILAGIGAVYWFTMGPYWGSIMFGLNVIAVFMLAQPGCAKALPPRRFF